MIETLSGRLNTWGHKYISFGGRIVLINSVLNSIPIFYLFLMKMPVLVWRRIVRIQREFLWGGVGGGRKINWVRWKSVCNQKRHGGAGVKDIRVMNVSLLAKWRWRLLDGNPALWKNVLEEKYGNCVGRLVEGGGMVRPNRSSLWWKELVNIDNFGGPNWFNSEVVRRVGNGLNSSFWNDTWKGGRCFRDKYPRLFLISMQKEAKVGEIGLVSGQDIDWAFSWRRHLFMWEEEVLLSLKEDLEDTRLSSQEDEWRWQLEDTGVFSVKSTYVKLEELVLYDELWTEEENGVFDKLWKSPAPSKVVAFAWRTLLNRIPTKSNLVLRHVIGPEDSLLCALCGRVEESTIHLFLHCDVASSVWLYLMRWLDHVFPTPPNLFVHFEVWSVGTRNKNVKKGLRLIWLATIWVLWKARNDKIFKGTNFEVDEMIEAIKVLTWRWMLSRMTTSGCLFL